MRRQSLFDLQRQSRLMTVLRIATARRRIAGIFTADKSAADGLPKPGGNRPRRNRNYRVRAYWLNCESSMSSINCPLASSKKETSRF